MPGRSGIVCGGVILGVACLAAYARSAEPGTQPLAREMPHYGAWQASCMGAAEDIIHVVLCPSNPSHWYAYLATGGLYGSEDGGLSWRSLQGRLPQRAGCFSVRSLLVDPRDDRHVMVALGSQWAAPEGIYVSENAGQSWAKRLEARFQNDLFRKTGFVLARHPRNPDVVLAAAIDSGVWRSADNGRSWSNLGPRNVNPTDVRFDRSQPQRIWLCTAQMEGHVNRDWRKLEGGFFRSEDGGRTWWKVLEQSPLEIIQDPKDSRRLYGIFNGQAIRSSTDNGDSWADYADGLPAEHGPGGHAGRDGFSALACGPGFVLAGTMGGGLYRLESGQGRWIQIRPETIRNGRCLRGTPAETRRFGGELFSLVVDPADADHWIMTGGCGIYQTRDAGRTWDLTIHGIECAVVCQVLGDPSDPAIVHLGTAGLGYLRSTDGGKSFRQVRMAGSCAQVKDLALSPKLPRRVYAIGSGGYESRIDRIYVTEDGGTTWEAVPTTGLPEMSRHQCASLAVDPADPYTVYLAVCGIVSPVGGGPYRSSDGGRSWRWMGQGLPEEHELFATSIWGSGRQIAVGQHGSLLCISQDEGLVYRFDPRMQSWSKCEIRTAGKLFSVAADVLTPGRFYLAGEAGVLRTLDGGLNWERVHERGARWVVADEAVAHRAAASTEEGLILTRDGGRTWAMMDKSLPDRVRQNVPAFVGERLVVGSGGSGCFWMPLSREGERPVRPRMVQPASGPSGVPGPAPR